MAALVAFSIPFAEATSLPQETAVPSLARTLLSVESLPRFRPVASVGAFISYDRTGGNDDGFSGKYSFLRKDGDALIIAEVTGPGAITRIPHYHGCASPQTACDGSK
jgi:hypothetical protein